MWLPQRPHNYREGVKGPAKCISVFKAFCGHGTPPAYVRSWILCWLSFSRKKVSGVGTKVITVTLLGKGQSPFITLWLTKLFSKGGNPVLNPFLPPSDFLSGNNSCCLSCHYFASRPNCLPSSFSFSSSPLKSFTSAGTLTLITFRVTYTTELLERLTSKRK